MIIVELPIKDPKKPPQSNFPDRCVDCSKPQTYAFPYVLDAFVGMIADILIGSLVEFVLKIVFVPAYGKLLLKRPLTVFQS